MIVASLQITGAGHKRLYRNFQFGHDRLPDIDHIGDEIAHLNCKQVLLHAVC
jgi:hypothetical protein